MYFSRIHTPRKSLNAGSEAVLERRCSTFLSEHYEFVWGSQSIHPALTMNITIHADFKAIPKSA